MCGKRYSRSNADTVRSAIARSSSDCTCGRARLISLKKKLTSRSWWRSSGPGSMRGLPAASTVVWYTRSPGIMSTVPSTRSNSPPTARANARSSVVLPMPTSPSSSTWPRANSATSSMRTVPACPTMARPTSSSRRRASTRQSCSDSSAGEAPRSSKVGRGRLIAQQAGSCTEDTPRPRGARSGTAPGIAGAGPDAPPSPAGGRGRAQVAPRDEVPAPVRRSPAPSASSSPAGSSSAGSGPASPCASRARCPTPCSRRTPRARGTRGSSWSTRGRP